MATAAAAAVALIVANSVAETVSAPPVVVTSIVFDEVPMIDASTSLLISLWARATPTAGAPPAWPNAAATAAAATVVPIVEVSLALTPTLAPVTWAWMSW